DPQQRTRPRAPAARSGRDADRRAPPACLDCQRCAKTLDGLARTSPRATPPTRTSTSSMKTVLSLFLVASVFLAGCGRAPENPSATGGDAITVALLPKSKGNAYFISCKDGAEKAAQALGVDLLFD